MNEKSLKRTENPKKKQQNPTHKQKEQKPKLMPVVLN